MRESDTTRPKPSKTAVAAAVLGNALEFYDFLIYAAFAVMIGHAFFPTGSGLTSLLLSVATFGVGFVTRPLGGIVIGAYADRAGRRAAMTLTMCLMAVGSGVVGILPTFATIGWAAPVLLVVARLIQGFSAGGELGASTSYLIEAAPPGREGLFGSWQLSSQFMSSIIGGLIGFAVTRGLSSDQVEAWGWRIPFLLGTVIAPVGLYIRARLKETLPIGEVHQSSRAVLADLLRGHWKMVLAATLAVPGSTVTQYFLSYLTTYAITALTLPADTAMLTGFVVGVVGAAFALAGGWAADRFGFKIVAILPRLVLMAVLYPVVVGVVRSPDEVHLFAAAAILSALQATSAAVSILVISRAFPPKVRTSGMSVAYAIAVTLFGGTAQFVFTWLIERTGDPLAPVWYVMGMNLVTLLGISLLRSASSTVPHPEGRSPLP